MFSENGLGGSLQNSADKELAILLPLVEMSMALISPVGDGRFAGVDDFADKRALAFFAVGQKNLPGDAPVDIEPHMGLGFLTPPRYSAHSMDNTASIKEPSMATSLPRCAWPAGITPEACRTRSSKISFSCSAREC